MNYLWRDIDGRLRDQDGAVVACSWFLMCDRDARDVIEHPILGGVPVCDRCRDLADGAR